MSGPVTGLRWIYVFVIFLLAPSPGLHYEDVDYLPGIYPLRPNGLRVVVKDRPGITSISFHANINQAITKWQNGDINLELAFNGKEWSSEDQRVELADGDHIFYWTYTNAQGNGEIFQGRSIISRTTSTTNPKRVATRQNTPTFSLVPSIEVSPEQLSSEEQTILASIVNGVPQRQTQPSRQLATGHRTPSLSQQIIGPGSSLFPSVNTFIPAQNDFTLSQGGFTSPQNVFTPPQNGVIPNQNGVIPNQNGFISNQNGFIPNQNGFSPNQNGVIPNQNGVIPNQNVLIPNQNGLIPNQNGVIPNQNGVIPNQNGFIPNQNGYNPNQNAYNPNQNGYNPNQNGYIPNQNGYIPNQNGFSPNQNGYNPSLSNFNPSNAGSPVVPLPITVNPATPRPSNPVFVSEKPIIQPQPGILGSPKFPGSDRPQSRPLTCENSGTTVNGRPVCKDQVILFDTFNYYNTSVWSYDMEFPSLPDSEFCIFTGLRDNSLTTSGSMRIWPTLTEDKYGKDFIRTGTLTLPDCSAINADHCKMDAEFAYILPPTLSTRYSTRNKWSFRYGRVDIVAKLSRGDWLYPEFWLVPERRNLQSDFTNRLEIAVVRGNARLRDNRGNEIGAQLLEAGASVPTSSRNDLARKVFKLTEPNNRLWTDDFHTYSVLWTRDAIAFSVDGREIGVLSSNYDEVSASMFNEEMNLVLGLGVGGVRVFPDSSDKPWTNTEPKAMYKFWSAKDRWYRTWSREASTLIIREVKVTSL